jgi:hypothetical protein
MSEMQPRGQVHSHEWPPVLTKRDFVERYAKGEFGNAAPTWHDAESFLKSGYKGLVHIRNRVAGGPTWYNVDSGRAYSLWYEITGSGLDASTLYISAMCPTEKTLIQGEIYYPVRDEHSPEAPGIKLLYSLIAKPMREALAVESRHATGMKAEALLRYYMNPKSYDWTQVLLDRYKNHVIEFTTLGTCWGTLEGYNTLWWEIRLY